VTDPPAAETVDAANGLFSMTLAPGWDVNTVADDLKPWYETAEGTGWEFLEENTEEIANLSSETGVMSVIREGRYHLAPGVFDWDASLRDYLGLNPNVSLTVEWGGGRGNSTRGTINGISARLDTVEVGDQLIAILSSARDDAIADVNADIDAMIASAVIDPSTVSLLNHSIDLKVDTSAETTGSTPFRFGILAQPNWLSDPEVDAFWRSPDSEGYVDVYTYLNEGADFDTLIARELDDNGASDWFTVPPQIDDVVLDGVPARVYWEGDPATTDAALVFVSDGVVFVAAYLYAPGVDGLMQEMVQNIQIRLSAVQPE
jgi:hypothetical protein